MPSSMRPTITKIGTELVKVRKDKAPRPKQNAIGTPMTRRMPTPTTRNTTMFQLPSGTSAGSSANKAPPTAPTTAAARRSIRALPSRTSCMITVISIRPRPTGRAEAR